jgi:glucose/arabinose dehydrogenase
MRKLILIPLFFLMLATDAWAEVRLDPVELPPGFNIEIYAKGWPNDVLVMPDGALLISDDFADVICRVSYTK